MVISFFSNISHHHFTFFSSRWSFNCCMILQWLTCSPTCLQSYGTTTLRRMTRWARGLAIPRADGHLLRWFLCGAPGRAVAPLSRRGTGWDGETHMCVVPGNSTMNGWRNLFVVMTYRMRPPSAFSWEAWPWLNSMVYGRYNELVFMGFTNQLNT